MLIERYSEPYFDQFADLYIRGWAEAEHFAERYTETEVKKTLEPCTMF